MASAEYTLDDTDYDRIMEAISKLADGSMAEKIINETLLDSGQKLIKEKIMNFLPESGRTWNRKALAAKSTEPFTHIQEENLSVTVRTKNIYHYLYFPDDGSNTMRHEGNQRFMQRGGDEAATKIVDDIIEKLLKKFEEE